MGHPNKMFRFPSPSLSWRWVGQSGKKKKKKWTHAGFWVPVKAGLLTTKLGYVVLSLIRWYNRNRTTKCLKRLQKRSIEYDNLRQLVLIRQDHVLVNLSTCFFRSDSDFFFTFPKKWVGRAIGNETLIYGDGHMVQFMLRVSSRQTIFCLVTNEPLSLSTLIYVIPIRIWVGNAITTWFYIQEVYWGEKGLWEPSIIFIHLLLKSWD